MAAIQQEFDAGAILTGLYEDLPHVKKVGYSIGEMEGIILVRVVIDCDNDDGFLVHSSTAVKKALEFEEELPVSMKEAYYVVPLVGSLNEGALLHFSRMDAVIDR